MTKLLTLCLLVVVAAVPGVAQTPDPEAGYIGLFSDPGANDCSFYDIPGILFAYVVHMDAPLGATSVEFRVDQGPNTSLIWLADNSYHPLYWGNSQTGIVIAWGTCIPTPNLVMEIIYFSNGISPPCSEIRVVPIDVSQWGPEFDGQIVVEDCNNIPLVAEGRGAIINPTPECSDCGGVPVAEEKSTWGSLKSLYR